MLTAIINLDIVLNSKNNFRLQDKRQRVIMSSFGLWAHRILIEP